MKMTLRNSGYLFGISAINATDCKVYNPWYCNLILRAHESFGLRQDSELWNNQFPESKILGLSVPRRMRALA